MATRGNVVPLSSPNSSTVFVPTRDILVVAPVHGTIGTLLFTQMTCHARELLYFFPISHAFFRSQTPMNSVDHLVQSLLRPVRRIIAPAMGWLSRVPIDDPIDRRNAPTMQAAVPRLRHDAADQLGAASVPFRRRSSGVAAGRGHGHGHGAARALRRGDDPLRPVSTCRHYVRVVVAAGVAGRPPETRLPARSIDQTSQMLSLAIGGLVLGRRALWSVFLAIVAIFVAGLWADALRAQESGQSAETAFHYLPSAIFSYFVITLVLDRCITALRASLSESEDRRRDLCREIGERERAQSQSDPLAEDGGGRAPGQWRRARLQQHPRRGGGLHAFAPPARRHRPRPSHHRRRDGRRPGRHRAIRAERHRPQQAPAPLRPPGPVAPGAGRCRSGAARDPADAAPAVAAHDRHRLDVADEPMPVLVDHGHLELAMLNIASNARDAMPEGGEFRIDRRAPRAWSISDCQTPATALRAASSIASSSRSSAPSRPARAPGSAWPRRTAWWPARAARSTWKASPDAAQRCASGCRSPSPRRRPRGRRSTTPEARSLRRARKSAAGLRHWRC